MNIQQRREILEGLLAKGKFATVTYKKVSTGEVVTRNIKLWVERHLSSGDRNVVGTNVGAERDPNIFVYSDMVKDAFRSFKLTELLSVKGSGQEFTF
jgi:hypothetical protein